MLGEYKDDTGSLFNRADLRYDQRQKRKAKPLCMFGIKDKTFRSVCVHAYIITHIQGKGGWK